ncbi:hypothetical protein NXW62_13355 [Bacteroides fragilis]|nr:hypothetical protein [Bacteroides fragilis]
MKTFERTITIKKYDDMRKQILTDNETKTFLMKTFGCSRQAV